VTIVLFDWNGTLVDDRDRAWESAEATLAAYGRHGIPARHVIEAAWCLPVAAFLADLGVPSTSTAAAVRRWNHEMAGRPVAARPGAREVLDELRVGGIAVGVVSAAAPSLVLRDLALLGLERVLDHLHVGIDDKAAVLAAHPGPVVYVGDSEADMEAAVRADAVPVAIAGGYRSVDVLRAAGARVVIDQLAEVLDLLELSPGCGPGAPRPRPPGRRAAR
jgi:phosphoglycolate phosphatase